jgi:hypothetical protein
MRAVTALLLIGALFAGGPARAAEDRDGTCVDVRIGSERYYDCINLQLRAQVPQRRFSASTDAPLNAAAPAPTVGSFSESATRESLGSSFGHSVRPQRPAPIGPLVPLNALH